MSRRSGYRFADRGHAPRSNLAHAPIQNERDMGGLRQRCEPLQRCRPGRRRLARRDPGPVNPSCVGGIWRTGECAKAAFRAIWAASIRLIKTRRDKSDRLKEPAAPISVDSRHLRGNTYSDGRDPGAGYQRLRGSAQSYKKDPVCSVCVPGLSVMCASVWPTPK